MYLTKLTLNPLNSQAMLDIANPYELHRSLSWGVSQHLGNGERILFRLEPSDGRNNLVGVVLVQTVFEPDWCKLQEREGYLLAPIQVKKVEPLAFQQGQVLRFRLRANPICRKAEAGKRIALTKLDDRLAWLKRKGEQAGFITAEDFLICRDAPFRGFEATKEVNGEKQTRKITIHMVDFDGLLQVADPGLLQKGIASGIGPAKGMGCGMLSLAAAF